MVHYISTRKDWIVKPLIIPILASLKELENLKKTEIIIVAFEILIC